MGKFDVIEGGRLSRRPVAGLEAALRWLEIQDIEPVESMQLCSLFSVS